MIEGAARIEIPRPCLTSNPGIKLGICGEQGGDPDSVKFCHKLGLTYVSCSPKRVPVARLAAAQAAIAWHQARPDKEWSLTDCISFVVMQGRGLSRALAYDHHFEQAGFEPLLRRDP